MALELSCDGELSEALPVSQAGKFFNQLSELCDQMFNFMTSDVINCECVDIYDKTVNLQNDSNWKAKIIILNKLKQTLPQTVMLHHSIMH